MRFTTQFLRGVSCLALLVWMTGCSGIQAQKSFSILDLLLPGAGGFIKADPPDAQPDLTQPVPLEKPVLQPA